MSRSYKKPVIRNKVHGNSYSYPIACCGDTSYDDWKKSYNRSMRRHNRQEVKVLAKEDPEFIDEADPKFQDDPEKTLIGNSWNSPGDGKYLYRNDPEGYCGKEPFERREHKLSGK